MSDTLIIDGYTSASIRVSNNNTIPITNLQTISYASILASDQQEIGRLRNVCQNLGFFYLDFRSDEPHGQGSQIAADLVEAFAAEERYFDKHCDSAKIKDIEIRDDDLTSAPSNIPAELQYGLPLFTKLSKSLREANLRMASVLYPDLISQNHAPEYASDSALDLIYAPTRPLESEAPDTTHTDGGTMTILCSDSWGIKIEDPITKEWSWVEPKPGCGLVNVGDWFDKESKRVDIKGVHSCRHAVSQVGDGLVKRYYIVHYLRPGKLK